MISWLKRSQYLKKSQKNPTDEIVKSCTKENAVVASRSKTSRSMNVVATAYSVVQ